MMDDAGSSRNHRHRNVRSTKHEKRGAFPTLISAYWFFSSIPDFGCLIHYKYFYNNEVLLQLCQVGGMSVAVVPNVQLRIG